MSIEIARTAARISSGLSRVVNVFLAGEGLPFSQIVSAERIERFCRQHDCLFGQHGIYSTSVVLWAFLSQVLRDGKEAACQAAVASIAVARLERGEEPPSEDTGDSCRARAKLAPQALKAISCEVAEELEQAADPGWLWKGTHHAKLVDGFTFTMPDTPANQQQYPQAKTQQPGIGLPIARATAIMSLATGAIMNLACGPYQGKQTGETALLRCKTPKMVEAEVWATILAYNLIRTTGRRRGGAPRQAAAADQLHCGLPIHPLRMDAALRQPATCGHLRPPAATCGHLRPPCGNFASGCSGRSRRARSPTGLDHSNHASSNAEGTATR